MNKTLKHRAVYKIRDTGKHPFSITNSEEVDFQTLKEGDLFILRDDHIDGPEKGNTLNLAIENATEINGVPSIQCIVAMSRENEEYYGLLLDETEVLHRIQLLLAVH